MKIIIPKKYKILLITVVHEIRSAIYHHAFYSSPETCQARPQDRHPDTAPPPPPPPSIAKKTPTPAVAPQPPAVAAIGPSGAFMIELLIFNGYPFKDHWAYWVRSHTNANIGVVIHATGDARNGFKLEFERSHAFRTTEDPPTKRIPLQWVNGQYFDERAMLNNEQYKVDNVPVCRFEASAYKVKAPQKSLNTTDDKACS